MNAACSRGEIKQSVCDEFNSAGMKLPRGSKEQRKTILDRVKRNELRHNR